jgi:hypothetical protein
MRGRSPILRDYGWEDARLELADGCHPEVVAARLGEPIDIVLKTADEQAWPITWDGAPPQALWADA